MGHLNLLVKARRDKQAEGNGGRCSVTPTWARFVIALPSASGTVGAPWRPARVADLSRKGRRAWAAPLPRPGAGNPPDDASTPMFSETGARRAGAPAPAPVQLEAICRAKPLNTRGSRPLPPAPDLGTPNKEESCAARNSVVVRCSGGWSSYRSPSLLLSTVCALEAADLVRKNSGYKSCAHRPRAGRLRAMVQELVPL
jgi:hypothetical protein